MFVSAEELTNAIARVSTIANLDKKWPGILFDIKDNSIDIYYNSQQKAIINTIKANVGADEKHGKVIFDFKRLCDTINYCKGTGRIKVNSIEIQLNTNPDGTGTAKFYVTKFMSRYDGTETKDEVVSSNIYDLTWTPEEKASLAQKVLTNPACDDMFSEDGAENWDVENLVNMINYASSCNAKTMYTMKTFKGMFAHDMNSAFAVFVQANKDLEMSLNLQTAQAKAIVAVLKSMPDIDEIKINTLRDGNNAIFAFLFFTEDKSLSIYIGAAARSAAIMTSANKYLGTQYKNYNFNILTDVLIDTLKAVSNLSATQDGIITFRKEDNGQIIAKFNTENTNASVNNEYKIHCDNFNTTETIENGNDIISIKPNMKVLLDVVSNNKQDYTAFDIDTTSGENVTVRIGFVDFDKSIEVVKELAKSKGIVIDSPAPAPATVVETAEVPVENTEATSGEEFTMPENVFESPEATQGTVDDEAVTSEDAGDGAALASFMSSMTVEDKLEIRKEYLTVSYYSTMNRA